MHLKAGFIVLLATVVCIGAVAIIILVLADKDASRAHFKSEGKRQPDTATEADGSWRPRANEGGPKWQRLTYVHTVGMDLVRKKVTDPTVCFLEAANTPNYAAVAIHTPPHDEHGAFYCAFIPVASEGNLQTLYDNVNIDGVEIEDCSENYIAFVNKERAGSAYRAHKGVGSENPEQDIAYWSRQSDYTVALDGQIRTCGTY